MAIERGISSAAVALVVALGATTAHGDGYCEKGFRDTTAAEQAGMVSVLDAAKKALPAAPTGWVIQNESGDSAPTSFCRDQESVPWSYGISRYYQRVDDREARSKALQDAATEYTTSLAAKQPQLDAIMAKMTALSQEVAAAVQKNDMARVEELNKEVEKVGAEYKQVAESGGATEKLQAVSAQVSQDVEMTVAVRINSGYEGVLDGAASFPVPAGAHSAYRWSDKRGDVTEDQVLVLFGDWQAPSGGSVQAVTRAATTPPGPQVISVRVAAAAGRIAAMVDAVDFNALAATLAK